MALATSVQGSLRPSQIITWQRGDTGAAEDLTNAALTGWIRDLSTDTVRAVQGTLTITDAAAGEFQWAFDPADVAYDGTFDVQFVATFLDAPTPALTFVARWKVSPSIIAPEDAGTVVDIAGCVSLTNRTTDPTAPTSGYRLYIKHGVLSLIDSSGVVTTV